MQVGDLVLTGSGKSFRITGVFCDGEQVGLASLNDNQEFVVPAESLEESSIYRKVYGERVN